MRANSGIRGGSLLVGCAVTSGALTSLAWPSGTGWGGLLAAPPDQSLPALLCLAMSAVCAWVTLLVLAGLASRRSGTTGRLGNGALRRLAPAAVRRGVEVLLGATTVLAIGASAAQATPAPAARPAAAAAAAPAAVAAGTITSPLLAGLDRPAAATPAPPQVDLDRPAADPSRGISLVTTVATRSPVQQAESAIVTVQHGDSLWRIAARSLPDGAGQRAIEKAWHRWYEANRDVIGGDPNLLQPGQHLVPPQS